MEGAKADTQQQSVLSSRGGSNGGGRRARSQCFLWGQGEQDFLMDWMGVGGGQDDALGSGWSKWEVMGTIHACTHTCGHTETRYISIYIQTCPHNLTGQEK